jgi:hypothetical protein
MCQVGRAAQMRHFGLAIGAKLKTQGVQIENNMDYWYKFQELAHPHVHLDPCLIECIGS